MANYHFEVQTISRKKGKSITRLASYISGRRLKDSYTGKTYYNNRDDVLMCHIFQPDDAPPGFYNLQYLCNEINKAERRRDARTAREFKCSLPNELSNHELIRMVNEYINLNFTNHGLCAIAAIHKGKNEANPSQNNPHVHIIVPTRPVDSDGFCRKKDREHDKPQYIHIWRENWADVQNRAYERNRFDIRVSHKSLEEQGIFDRQPANHLSYADWQRERRGERTLGGDKRRKILEKNREISLQHQPELKLLR